METFFVFAFILLFFSGSRSNFYFILSFILLFVISAFRDVSVGTDTKNYLMIFERVQQGIEIRQEYLWQLINEGVIYLGGDFQLLLILSSLLVIVPIFWVSKKISVNPNLSIFLYYTLYLYFPSLNIARQCIAVSIVFIAIMFLQQKKKYVFIILVIIASGFHITAILVLPLLFVNRLPGKDGDKFYYLVSVITIFIGIFFSEVIYRTAGDALGYLRYVERYEIGTMIGNFLFLIILNAFLFFTMKASNERGFLFKLFFVFIIATNLSIRIPFNDRFVLYFATAQILYLPLVVQTAVVRPKQVVPFVIVLYAFILFFRKFGAGDIIPYVNTLIK